MGSAIWRVGGDDLGCPLLLFQGLQKAQLCLTRAQKWLMGKTSIGPSRSRPWEDFVLAHEDHRMLTPELHRMLSIVGHQHSMETKCWAQPLYVLDYPTFIPIREALKYQAWPGAGGAHL